MIKSVAFASFRSNDPWQICFPIIIMSFLQIIETTAILLLLLLITGAIRRLFFHPLSHIPGPTLAALTWWYEFYFDGIQEGRYVFKIQKLHKQYGPIIRITPDELHIDDIGFLDTLYAPSMVRRDKYEYQLRSLRIPGGVGTTANHDVHKKRRDALTPFFSKRNILHLENLINQKVAQLSVLVSEHARTKDPINLSDAFFAFTNDVVTNFLFAHQTNVLASEAQAATLRKNSNQLLLGINMNKHFPWLPDFLESLPLSISKPLMSPGLIDLLNLFDEIRAELIPLMKAKASGNTSKMSLGPTRKESVFSSVLDNPNLPPTEKSILRLEQEGTLLVLAGTESPAHTLNIIFYHVLANPKILKKLRDELSEISSEASLTQLEQLPYLSAIIEEGNRLSFGVTARLARIAYEPLIYTPSSHVQESIKAAGKSFPVTIPAGTPVSITTLSAHTNESVFPSPYTFDPDRWLGEEGRERRKFQFAFGKGGRKCLGIELARAELVLVITALVRSFDMTLWETDESDVTFVHDFHVAMPNLDSKGIRIIARAR